MRFVRVGDINVHYSLEGPEGTPVILFANSLGTDLRIWDAVADDLRRDARVLRYDLRGHGLTDATDGPYSIAMLAEDAVGLLDALGLDRVHVCGLSIGGMIAQKVAGAWPERIDRLILCDTTMRMPEPAIWTERASQAREQGLADIAAGAIERWFTADFQTGEAAYVAGVRNMVQRTSVEGYAACCEAISRLDLEANAAAIGASALVVVGEHDPATPPTAAEAIADAIPKSLLQVLEGQRHLACIERTDTFLPLLRDFLGGSPDI